MNKLILKCEQCGDVFAVHTSSVEYFDYVLHDTNTNKPRVNDGIAHKCLQFNDKLKNKLSLSEIEDYVDCEIIGKCKVIGVVRTPK